VRNFQIKTLIVSAAKIGKQCLQLIQPLGDSIHPSDPLPGLRPSTHWATFVPQTPWAIVPK